MKNKASKGLLHPKNSVNKNKTTKHKALRHPPPSSASAMNSLSSTPSTSTSAQNGESDISDIDAVIEQAVQEREPSPLNDDNSDIERFKVYKSGKLGKAAVMEILEKYQNGILIRGSNVLGSFARLIYADSKIEAAAMCLTCKKFYPKFNTARSTFYNHQKIHHGHSEADYNIPGYFKDLITEKIADMCAIDMVPLSIIERPGFRDVLQTVIKQSYELGIQHCSNEICSGLPGIDAILCTRNTLKKTILDTVSHLKQKFIDYVTSNINKNGGAVSTDFTVKGTSFYVITVHFITDQWDLKHYTLDFGEYGKEDSYGISVLDNFLTVMDNNGIDRNMVKKKIIITTDRGSNMINAFGEPYIRLDDTCHQLSIMSKRLYDPYKENYLPANFEIAQDIRDILSQVAETLKFCTTIITAVNSRPKLKNDLKKEGATLLQHCDVRWLTRYRSIDSFLKLSDDHKERIFDELYEHKFNNRYIYREAIDNIRQNSSLLTDYCAVVEPFNQAIRTLEAEKVCTVNKTLIQYNNLELHFKACIDRRNASPAMKAMAESGLTVLNYQRTIPSTISDYHWLGLMMDPLYKDEMSLFSNFNGQRAVTLFKNYVRKYNNASAPPQNDVDQPPSAFAAFTDTTHDLLSVECDTYLNLRSSFLRTQYENVLDFWRAEEAKYPHIAKAAKHVLSITSSSPSERVFSVTGNTLTPHRMCMSPEVTSALVNMKSLKRFEEEQKQSGLIC